MWANLNKSYAQSSHKTGNPKSAEHKRFEYWLKGKPCQVPACGQIAVTAHHEPYKSQAGWSHTKCIGLCLQHHVNSPDGRHFVSDRDKFNELHGMDVLKLAIDNWKAFKCSR